MGIFRLVLEPPGTPGKHRVIAEHLDPAWLKQRGYEIARNLGEQAAVWAPQASCPGALALRCRSGHALAIVTD